MSGKDQKPYVVGTAGWAIPALVREQFFAANEVKPNHLKAYSSKLTGVEINSSFYRDHKGKTYLRWRETSPDHFRFSIKLSKKFTHEQRLNVDTTHLKNVLADVSLLGEKLGAILVQTPPKLTFDSAVAEDFFASLRELTSCAIVFEPRHPSWNSREAMAVLKEQDVSRVIAEPDPIPLPSIPRHTSTLYFRLHGTPKIYYSDYTQDQIEHWAKMIVDAMENFESISTWCIFDNTAMGYATANALQMLEILKSVDSLKK